MNRILNISLLLLFLCEVGISAQSELTRHHKTSFDEYTASAIEKLSVSNRHGLIQYTGWDQDTLAIRVSIWVEAPNSDIAAEVYDQINISQHPSGKTVDYSTTFRPDFYSNFNFGIDYHIFGPKDLTLELYNRLGDINIEEYSGTATITAEYGNLKIAEYPVVIPKAVINITNGDLEIGHLKNAEIIHKNGRLELGSAVELSLTSDFSTAGIHKIEKLNLTATTSKMNIGQANSVNFKTKYTDIIISELQQQGFIETNQGSVNIQSIKNSLKELTIAGDHTPIQLHIADSLPFNLNGQVTDGQFIYPENKNIRTFKENNTLSFSGEYKSKNKPAPSLILFNKNSDINLIVIQ